MPVHRISRAEEVEQLLLGRLQELASPDGRLPTEAEIAEMFNVSRTTVRTAVGALVARGLVVRRQGMGTFINQGARIANPLDVALDFCELIAQNGYEPGIQHLPAALTGVDEETGTALNCAGQQALQRHTIFTADGVPVIYTINTIPLWVLSDSTAQEIIRDPAISEPIYAFLSARCSQHVELSRATIWPDLARNCPMRDGFADPLTPVLVINEVGFNGAGSPILHSLEFYPGRVMRFELIRWRSSKQNS
jgi:GntR family transcriptional regulator